MRGIEAGLLDLLPVALVVTDRSGRVAYWNRGAEQLYGWSRAEALGRPVPEPIGLPGPGDAWEGDLVLCRRDGSEVPVHTRNRPIQDRSGNPIGFIFVGLDIGDSRPAGTREGVEIGRRVAQARKEAGLTQQELADRLEVTKRSLQGYESGAVIPYRHLGRLADLLGRGAAWFLAGDRARVREELAEALRERDRAFKDEMRELFRTELLDLLGARDLVA
jgi:transcriptional regulator with XRE-family HTH domain